MGDNGLSIADAMAIARGNNCGSHAEGGSWGSDWVLFLFFLMAWGGGGAFGFGGDRGFGVNAPALQGTLTRADLTEGFNNQAVLSKLDGLTNGQCDSTYALTNAINGISNQLYTLPHNRIDAVVTLVRQSAMRSMPTNVVTATLLPPLRKWASVSSITRLSLR